MGAILPSCFSYGKAGGLQIPCYQGIAVDYYGFTLDALYLKLSDSCNVGVRYRRSFNMRPYILHLCILAALMIPGVGLFIMEMVSSQSGGLLFRKYDATKLYWLSLIGYSVVTTLIVLSMHLFFRIQKRRFSKNAIIFGHILPVAAVWVFIQLGLHDQIQDTWRDHVIKKQRKSKQVYQKPGRPRVPVPRAPLSKQLIYQQSGNAIEPKNQTATAGSD